MIVAIVVVVAVLAAGAAVAAAYLARARAPVAAIRRAEWPGAAGEEFAELSESGRCDLIFALAALDDGDSLALLERALDDPSETVALAAAHALDSRGGSDRLQRYFAEHPGVRATRIAQTLALLGGVSPSS